MANEIIQSAQFTSAVGLTATTWRLQTVVEDTTSLILICIRPFYSDVERLISKHILAITAKHCEINQAYN